MSARGAAAAAVACALIATRAPASAHEVPALLVDLREGDGRVAVTLSASRAGVIDPGALRLPPSCAPATAPRVEPRAEGETWRFEARCGPLAGQVVAIAFAGRDADVLVRAALEDGPVVSAVLHPGAPSLRLPDARGDAAAAAFTDHVALGFRHILEGVDHLLFVLGLLVLARGRRGVVLTVTAFTAGHSVTLSLAALGLASLPPGPTEVAIALSLVVLAWELARARAGVPSCAARRPWLLAGSFGLLHGFGFAGALAGIGLPAGDVPRALLGFNVGVELGQLAFVAVVLAVWGAVRAIVLGFPAWRSLVPVYAIGSAATFFFLDRLAAL